MEETKQTQGQGAGEIIRNYETRRIKRKEKKEVMSTLLRLNVVVF